MKHIHFIPALLTLVALVLTGCGPSAVQTTPTVLTTATPTPSASPRPTATVMLTPTAAPTATITLTPTPSANPNWPLPGNYVTNTNNATVPLNQGGSLFESVGITIDENHHLIFNLFWRYVDNLHSYSFRKKSGKDNRNIYVIDNQGKRYDHIAGGGDAYKDVAISAINFDSAIGWFDFGVVGDKNLTYDFYDDDNDIIIRGIALLPGDRISLNEYFMLNDYPLLMTYAYDLWDVLTTEDGGSKLAYKPIPGCAITPQKEHAPKGDLKNQAMLNNITFDIYGYLLDETANLYAREYVYVSGLSNLNAKQKPFFFITIPAESSEACILATGNLLATLAPKKP